MMEDLATSEVEETYSVGEDDYNKDGEAQQRDSSPFQVAKDLNEEKEDEEEEKKDDNQKPIVKSDE